MTLAGIIPPTRADFDKYLNALGTDMRQAQWRGADLLAAWGALGADAQNEQYGYTADDVAVVTAFLHMVAEVEALYAEASTYVPPGASAPLSNEQLLTKLVPFVLPR